jgi:hypothetical protein
MDMPRSNRHFSALLLTSAAPFLFMQALCLAQAPLPDVVKPPPGINLGSTSFYDGFGRTKAGVTVLQYFRWSDNTEISNASGNENANFIGPRIESFPALTQLIVATKWHPFGGAAGFSALVPLVELHTSFAANSPKGALDNEFGIGDVIAGPTFQSKFFALYPARNLLRANAVTASAETEPNFVYRAQVLVQIPTGSFSSAKSSNVGSGYWAVVPYVAMTYVPSRRIEMSTRLNYQYNLPTTRIANPPPIPHLAYVNGQAGQLVYGNFTGSYRLTRHFYSGANGYGVYQLSPDKTNNINVGNARETQLYLGPGGGYDISKADTINVNLYLKLEAHNTASGPSLQVLYIHRF